jgi:serine phosphatase RsbU (regulator of sigma subunit)/CheY-like chemotaxis protein
MISWFQLFLKNHLIPNMKLVNKKNKIKSSVTTKPQLPPWKVLIVDDEPDIHLVTQVAFQGFTFADRAIKIFKAMSGREAREILSIEPDIAVAFIDVVMETDDAGLKLVNFIRNECQNHLIRLIIRTGQPGAAPEKEVVERYDIDDYKDKTELTVQKLYTTIRLALKSYQNLMKLHTNQQGLQAIVDMVKNLYQPEQSIQQIYWLILEQIMALCRSCHTNQIKPIDSAMILFVTEQSIEVQAAIGKFAQKKETQEIQAVLQMCAEAIQNDKLTNLLPELTLIPFDNDESKRTFICLENAHLGHLEQNLIHILTNQCTTAVKLAAAHQEITKLNEYLQADNIRMHAELEVARYLQQMVLPTHSELKKINNLEIVAFMEPADEVSGDYYDVLQYNEHVICGIGDVTGHGLESGLLMLMVQTTVRCLLNSGIRDSSQFLLHLNKIIYNYAQRMNIDKTLTLSFLDYQPISSEQAKGILRISGQHEEILVARQGGKIEHLDTSDLGFPIGLEANIQDFVSQKEIHLQGDDVVVLYTDGITEAINTNKQIYGLERFCEILSCNWQRSAEEIKQAVIADVRQHIGLQKRFDDITLIVIKPKNRSKEK